MTTQTEALKMAHDALIDLGANEYEGFGDVLDAIESALAQQSNEQVEPKPVAWRVRWPKMGGGYAWVMNDAPLMAEHGFVNEPLYTHPPVPTTQPEQEYKRGYADAMNWKVQNHLEHLPTAQPEQEPVMYDKTEMNFFAQNLYDQKMREGKRGHYESMFHVIHQCIKKVAPPQRKPLTDEMAVAAARVLSDRQAAACNVDCGDMWKMHGNDFLEDARAALEAAHGIKGDA